MNITERAAIVLREIDTDKAIPKRVKDMLKTAIEGLLSHAKHEPNAIGTRWESAAQTALTTLCDQWEDAR